MVDRAPEGDDREVSIEIVAPKTPVGVGAAQDDEGEAPPDDSDDEK
jgi:hypothetical protein